jgi:ribosomal protein S18 acetylase RimI-like enzyme
MSPKVDVLREATEETVGSLNVLLRQLSKSAPMLDRQRLAEIMSQSGTFLLVARSEGEIVGMLTLVTFFIPTGLRAWIEDVVVDNSVRGKGIGTALTRKAIDIAKEQGARTVDLTSRPSRQAAHNLYEGLGFRIRDTRVYRLDEAE